MSKNQRQDFVDLIAGQVAELQHDNMTDAGCTILEIADTLANESRKAGIEKSDAGSRLIAASNIYLAQVIQNCAFELKRD